VNDHVSGHLDETGQPCTRHVPSTEAMFAWAAIGARIAGFHHDSASKLQSLMMAIDEATELLGDERDDVRRALDTATTSLRDLHGLLTENRALARAPQRKPVALADLLRKASIRQGVKLEGDLGSFSVLAAAPSIVHALGLLCDQTAGPATGTRLVSIAVSATDSVVTAELTGSASAAPSSVSSGHTNESVAVAAFLLQREEGSLRCTSRGFVIQLPLAASAQARSAGDKP
jgi:hypothetical protein